MSDNKKPKDAPRFGALKLGRPFSCCVCDIKGTPTTQRCFDNINCRPICLSCATNLGYIPNAKDKQKLETAPETGGSTASVIRQGDFDSIVQAINRLTEAIDRNTAAMPQSKQTTNAKEAEIEEYRRNRG